ncbi:hypothetical protein BDZ89DRAFT_253284 [Hymenopellis radicata]|nr:hypothetical protein BDZ89DRAFT_253284 [Hymenopellis radicata]
MPRSRPPSSNSEPCSSALCTRRCSAWACLLPFSTCHSISKPSRPRTPLGPVFAPSHTWCPSPFPLSLWVPSITAIGDDDDGRIAARTGFGTRSDSAHRRACTDNTVRCGITDTSRPNGRYLSISYSALCMSLLSLLYPVL